MQLFVILLFLNGFVLRFAVPFYFPHQSLILTINELPNCVFRNFAITVEKEEIHL